MGSRSQGSEDFVSPYYSALSVEIKRLYSTNVAMRVRACIEIGHIAYHGGDILEMSLLNDSRIIDGLLAILTMERQQPVSLVVAALRTLSVIVRSNPQVISMLDSREAMKTLIDKLGHIDEEVRVYSCSCIYFFLLRNLSSHGPILSAAECQDQLRRAAQDDWSEMELNDAEEIMNLLEIPHDPLRVSGCIQSRMAPGTDPQVLMGDADD